MIRGGQQKQLQRRHNTPNSLPGSSSDGSFNLSSLHDNLTESSTAPNSSKNYLSSALQQERLNSQKLSSQSAAKKAGSRVPVSSNPTVSSQSKKTGKKELAGIVGMQHMKNQTKTQGATKKTSDQSANRKEESKGVAANLPLDSLYLCFEKLESVYDIVTCAAVCHHWQQAASSDLVWKALYMKWWQPCDKESMTLQSQHGLLPHGFETWRKAFISKYSHGKQKILSEEIMHAVNKSWIHVRRIPDRFSKHVKDCVPGNTMRKLMERLSLTFHVCINRDQPVRLKGKANVVFFPASCLLRYPTKASSRGGITLESLNSVKVMATSNKLLRTVTVASFTGQNWEMVSKAGASPGPLCLVQHCSSSGASLMVGTLFEGVYSTEISSSLEHSQEQVLLVMVSLHLSDLIWKMLELGGSPTSQLGHQIFPSDDPIYGLHGWHVSIQLHTFRRLCWTQDFPQVFWSSQDSIAGEKAVFLLISSMKHESFPGVLNSPWKAEVFSGELRGVFMLDFTLWDEGSEIAWHCTRAVCTEAATLATVEYGPPGMDGERMHMAVHDEKQGISISMNLCIPFTDLWNSSTHQDPSVVITDLHFALSSVFLRTWFGRSTI